MFTKVFSGICMILGTNIDCANIICGTVSSSKTVSIVLNFLVSHLESHKCTQSVNRVHTDFYK